jgi:WXG100 family type VII secretion target
MPDIESSRIEVPLSIAEAPTFLTRTAHQLQDELDALANKLASVKSQWTGRSGQSYTDVSDLWNADATALFNPHDGVLKQIADAVRAVGDNYDHTEDHNVRTWRTH